MNACNFPLCQYPAENDYCLHHDKHFGKLKFLKVTNPIAKMSAKRKVLQKDYVKIVKDMLKENPNCQIKQFGCTKKAEGLHHIIKRSESNLCDSKNLLRACNSCNTWVENNDAEARKKGFVKSKFKVD